MGAPVLRRVALPVLPAEFGSKELRALVSFLEASMEAESDDRVTAVGLAAPQVGASRQVLVVRSADPHVPLTRMHNPRVEHLGVETVLMAESCVSVPGLVAPVKRSASIAVDYQDEHGERRRAVCRGWVAGLLQHETDHLQGVLFVDRANPKDLAFQDEWTANVLPRLQKHLCTQGSFELV